MVNLHLTPVQRLANQAHNCKIDNYEGLRTGRCGGLVVSAQDFWLRGLVARPGLKTRPGLSALFLPKHFTFTVHLTPPRSINWYWCIVGEA